MKAIKIAMIMILVLNVVYSLYGWLSPENQPVSSYSPAEPVAIPTEEFEVAAADGLDLKALTALVKEVKSGQELERRLNEKDSINNMDLNGDQRVDYLFVNEYGDPAKKIGFSITDEPVKGEEQEVADVTVEKNGDRAEIQVVGNEQIYGTNAIFNDWMQLKKEEATDTGQGESVRPVYHSFFYPHPLWISPWYFGFYPSFFSPYSVMSRQVYSNRVNRYNTSSVRSGRNSYQRSSPTKITSPNRGKVAKQGIARSLKNPTSTQKQFQVTRNRNIKSGGFGRSSRPAAGSQVSKQGAASSFGSSSKSANTSRFGTSQKSTRSSGSSLFGRTGKSLNTGSFRSPQLWVTKFQLWQIGMSATTSIQLNSLLETLPEGSYTFKGDPSQTIENVTWDYLQVSANTLYFCIEEEEFQEPHIETNSLDYWETAVKAGAVCLLSGKGKLKNPPPGIHLIEADKPNQAMALIARTFYRNPLQQMKVIGITGTNGKTTTSQLIDGILIQAGHKTGVIGTIGIFYPSGKAEASHLSNPMATETFKYGRRMHEEGVTSLTMELTSHAGAFERNHAIDFDVAVFTNLTQDHLDYHKTIDAYKDCKLRHFQTLGRNDKKAFAIINVDDISGKDFVDAVDEHLHHADKVEILTYGIRNKDADLVAYPRQMTGGYSEFDIFLRGNHLSQIHLPIPGLFNIYNGLAAFGATFALGISIEQIVTGLKKAMRVDGRFERVDCGAEFEVYVDYAHTPDSLEKILQEIRGITRKKVFAVFGCGGDRDRSKRPLMGAVAAKMADVCIVTSDNPRSEDPQAIINEILAGIPKDSKTKVIIEPDRREAIYAALETASLNDSVLIAGKGHEDYQIIGKTKTPFLDRKVVQDYYKAQKARSVRAWVEVDRKRIQHNFQTILADKPNDLQVMSVVKDDGLGHGIVEMAAESINAGCSYLAVACFSEAIELRREFETIPILIFGERLVEEIPRCVRHGFSLQVQSVATAQLIADFSKKQRTETALHVKVDTGMGRYGIRWDKALTEFKAIKQIPGIRIEGIMTHFAQSDEAKKEYANLQWQRFQEILDALKAENSLPPLVHACNSGGYLDLPHAHGNMVRIGILPCGVYPSKVCRRIEIKGQTLQPAMRLLSRVAFLKTLFPGDSLGYGMHFTASQETKIAVIPIGYGDGYPRLRNNGYVLVRGQRAPLVGGNAMDATMVDVSGINEVQVGDEVVLLGQQNQEEITAMQLADWAGTVTYQILSGWNRRLNRVYL